MLDEAAQGDFAVPLDVFARWLEDGIDVEGVIYGREEEEAT